MLKGFKDFLMQGNVVDLAVAVVIGGAFAKVVDGLLTGFINPLIALIFGQPDVSKVGFTIDKTFFPVGQFFQGLVNFVLIAAAVYFFVIIPVKKYQKSRGIATDAGPTDVELLTEIRDLLRR